MKSIFRRCETRSGTSTCLWSHSSKRTLGWPTPSAPWSLSLRRCLEMDSGTMQSLRCETQTANTLSNCPCKAIYNWTMQSSRQHFGPMATTLLSGETSQSRWSRRLGGLQSSTRSWGRSSVWRGTCRQSSSTPTTRRRTPRSSKPSIKTRMNCSSMLLHPLIADVQNIFFFKVC